MYWYTFNTCTLVEQQRSRHTRYRHSKSKTTTADEWERAPTIQTESRVCGSKIFRTSIYYVCYICIQIGNANMMMATKCIILYDYYLFFTFLLFVSAIYTFLFIYICSTLSRWYFFKLLILWWWWWRWRQTAIHILFIYVEKENKSWIDEKKIRK